MLLAKTAITVGYMAFSVAIVCLAILTGPHGPKPPA
jgi:hypothetical protein